MSGGYDAWISITVGPLVIESGFSGPHYSPDVMRDFWIQNVRGMSEVIESAIELGLVQMPSEEPEYEEEEVED
jgi:hypothetical protein